MSNQANHDSIERFAIIFEELNRQSAESQGSSEITLDELEEIDGLIKIVNEVSIGGRGYFTLT